MKGLGKELNRLGIKGSGATRQCIAIARVEKAWDGEGNGGAKLNRRVDDAKGQELVALLATLYQAGKVTEQEAKAILAKHGF